jgi:hypothetical protein
VARGSHIAAGADDELEAAARELIAFISRDSVRRTALDDGSMHGAQILGGIVGSGLV